MLILDDPIKGFSNILTTTASNMSFGYNTNVNKIQRSERRKPKKKLQTDRPTEHLESFDMPPKTTTQKPDNDILSVGVLAYGLKKIMNR